MGFETPEDLQYTDEHEWVGVDDGRARIGITDFAQDQLTDVVYIELPAEDETYDQGDAFAVLESVKSVSDVYMPVDGTIVDVNRELEDEPGVINEDPYGDGWLVIIELHDPSQVENLMDASSYVDHTEA